MNERAVARAVAVSLSAILSGVVTALVLGVSAVAGHLLGPPVRGVASGSVRIAAPPRVTRPPAHTSGTPTLRIARPRTRTIVASSGQIVPAAPPSGLTVPTGSGGTAPQLKPGPTRPGAGPPLVLLPSFEGGRGTTIGTQPELPLVGAPRTTGQAPASLEAGRGNAPRKAVKLRERVLRKAEKVRGKAGKSREKVSRHGRGRGRGKRGVESKRSRHGRHWSRHGGHWSRHGRRGRHRRPAAFTR